MRMAFLTLIIPAALAAQAPAAGPFDADIGHRVDAVMPKVVAWRRDIHQHPELGNREFRTAKLVADHLRSLGIEVQEGVAHTGVVGILRGGKPGPVVALRADMDALPVREVGDLPFKSTVKAEYNGQQVDVMHACGHDNHVAILMGAAEVLAGMKAQLAGTVKFVFQPAEEGAPAGEKGGAQLMMDEGILTTAPVPSAIFGLHVWPAPAGQLLWRSGAFMAAADAYTIIVRGRQTHGSQPWRGIDPVVVSAQIINGVQTIISRQEDVTVAPSVLTVATVHGGARFNIIPDSVVMTGTIRNFDEGIRKDIHMRLTRTAKLIAESYGATAEVIINDPSKSFVTYNDPALTARLVPTLQRAAGAAGAVQSGVIMGSEDFANYQKTIPGVFFFLGITPRGQDPLTAAPNHSPLFFADESALPVGVRAMAMAAVDYLGGKK